jgi:hypothetical protein
LDIIGAKKDSANLAPTFHTFELALEESLANIMYSVRESSSCALDCFIEAVKLNLLNIPSVRKIKKHSITWIDVLGHGLDWHSSELDG